MSPYIPGICPVPMTWEQWFCQMVFVASIGISTLMLFVPIVVRWDMRRKEAPFFIQCLGAIGALTLCFPGQYLIFTVALGMIFCNPLQTLVMLVWPVTMIILASYALVFGGR